MFLKALTLVCFTLFALKILWNLRVPYVMLAIMWRRRPGDPESRGASVLPLVEWPLLAGWVALAAVIDADLWVYDARVASRAGISVAIGSYVHFLIVASFGTWIISRAKP